MTEVVITDGDVKARAIAPLPSTWCVAIPFAIRPNFGPIDTLCRDWATAILRELQPPDMVSADGAPPAGQFLGQSGHYLFVIHYFAKYPRISWLGHAMSHVMFYPYRQQAL
ncbi:hypothetical protein [Aeromonas caviae]|uniref:hypothetical protein n=1 Tax=Aeromonas caviae TaxID=648 RepID=UPI0039776E1A